jgi:hypothetical protein
MSNERIDEFLSWRKKLDDPAGVEGLDDHEATWERLMEKFREAPRRRPFFGYRLAAACVLLALIPAIRMLRGRPVPSVTMRPVELRQVVPARETTRPPETTHTAEATHAPETTHIPEASRTPETGQIARAPQTHRPEKNSPRATAAPHEQPVQLAGLTTSTSAISVPAPDSATIPQTGKGQLKIKPLRVVHINEISGGGDPAPAVTATGRRFEIFADPALLKVKIFSSN